MWRTWWRRGRERYLEMPGPKSKSEEGTVWSARPSGASSRGRMGAHRLIADEAGGGGRARQVGPVPTISLLAALGFLHPR